LHRYRESKGVSSGIQFHAAPGQRTEPDMIATRIPSPSLSAGTLVLAALVALLPGRADAQPWSGEGSGAVRTETRTVSGFHSVALSVHAKLKLRQGERESLAITGDDNIIPRVETVVENGTLQIRWADEGNYATHYKTLEIVVDARNIDGLAIRGSGQIHAERLQTDTLRATIEGSGAIAFDTLDADSVNATIHGTGHLSAAGRADSLDVSVAGSGKLSAARLASRRARITLQGSAQATVWAKDALSATIAGSGQIKYYGTPQLNQTVAGSGSIRRVGDAS
jgi:hypothetical protein